jgi:hypothetical protein
MQNGLSWDENIICDVAVYNTLGVRSLERDGKLFAK